MCKLRHRLGKPIVLIREEENQCEGIQSAGPSLVHVICADITQELADSEREAIDARGEIFRITNQIIDMAVKRYSLYNRFETPLPELIKALPRLTLVRLEEHLITEASVPTSVLDDEYRFDRENSPEGPNVSVVQDEPASSDERSVKEETEKNLVSLSSHDENQNVTIGSPQDFVNESITASINNDVRESFDFYC